MERPYIRGPRQQRAIVALLCNESVRIQDMERIIGALNPRDVIMQLRRQGFVGIRTRRFTTLDRDAAICYPGEYYIQPEDKEYYKLILQLYLIDGEINLTKKNAALTAGTVQAARTTSYLNSIQGGS